MDAIKIQVIIEDQETKEVIIHKEIGEIITPSLPMIHIQMPNSSILIMIEDKIISIVEAKEAEEDFIEVKEVHSIILEINIRAIINIDSQITEVKEISEVLDLRGKHIETHK